MRETHVYVFGAGASAAKPLCAPVTKDFLNRGFDLLSRKALLDAQGEHDERFPIANFWKVAELLDRLFGSNLVSEINDSIRSGVEYGKRNNTILLGWGCPIKEIPSAATIEELLAFIEL